MTVRLPEWIGQAGPMPPTWPVWCMWAAAGRAAIMETFTGKPDGETAEGELT